MNARGTLPRLALGCGEPAGIGPELVARLAATDIAADLVAIGDRGLIQRAAAQCGLALELRADDGRPLTRRDAGKLRLAEVPLAVAEQPGQPDPRNAAYVLETLRQAAAGCSAGRFDALVTAPVQKSVINEAGMRFTGHTEFLAGLAGTDVLMMLASPRLRVALATTHLPLAAVPAAITPALLERALRLLHDGLRQRFGIEQPRIAVLGLNPHAGEAGHLGREEIEVVEPLLERLRARGMQLLGPLPADTAFTPAQRQRYDAVLAMYHDQALPVLKAEAFDEAINITLGLPWVRTSVDHGTALDLAGRGLANPASMIAAARAAMALATPGRA
ncbi:MAG TPA: 4-hydroxythreonine-4-phosphate dehydrogenase PdxA [Rhodanobacteraceae bacterium]|nr:4-hydroxythreonine-4-phosphate dehydrogenase PdxA [Rhodanobacteraceae bacterium]